jgi:hypothetical protein
MTSSSPLFAFRSLAHDPQCVLAAINQFALVGIEQFADFLSGHFGRLLAGDEGLTTMLANSGYRKVWANDPQIAFRHDCSLAHLAGRA